jgi:predicted Zn-dependent peptidase
LNQLNLILGSMQTSRIIANVREQHGYSYNISSRLARRPGSSQWSVSGDVATAVTAPALREILHELARITAEPPGEDELRRFQTFLAGGLVQESATPAGIVETQRFFDLYDIPVPERDRILERVLALQPADLQRVARTYLGRDRLTIVVVGDRSALAGELAAIGRVVE